MLPREFYRLLHMHGERERAEEERGWAQTLLVVNHIRGALKAKPLSLDDLRRKAAAGDMSRAPSKAEYLKDLELLRRIEQGQA